MSAPEDGKWCWCVGDPSGVYSSAPTQADAFSAALALVGDRRHLVISVGRCHWFEHEDFCHMNGDVLLDEVEKVAADCSQDTSKESGYPREFNEGVDDVSALAELDAAVESVLVAWLNKYALQPGFFEAVGIRSYTVEQARLELARERTV